MAVRKRYIKYHRDGSIWARGQTVNGRPTGLFTWFRKDGTKMRSGYFRNGRQTGKWTTYDQRGKVYKVTRLRTPA